MDGATTTTSSTGGSNTEGGTVNNGASSGGGFLNLGNLGTSPAVVGGMGLFATGGGGGGGGADGGLASGSFGTPSLVGNGFTNDGSGSTGLPGAGGGPSSNPSFDLNDFPSLGGGAASGAGSTGSVGGGDNGLAAALRQQQQLLQQQMMQQQGAVGVGGIGVSAADKSSNLYRLAMSSGIANGTGPVASNNFSMTTEDFPALGASGGDGAGGAPGVPSEGGPTLVGAPSSTPGSGGILDPSSGGGNQLDYTGLIGSSGVATASSGIQQGSSNQTRSTSTATQSGSGSSSNAAGSSGNAGSGSSGGAIGGDYGLLGLLSVIRMTDADRNRLALGSDLTVLGLNLNSPDVLYSTFGGPFSDKPTTKEPHYQLPMCYYMQPPALKTGHLSKFQLETLFYIFYALPKDVLQAYAAQELYTREWRYHVESKLWFKRATPSDNNSASSGGGNGQQYIYFDINTWERRMYGNVNTNIAGGFLPEDDVRVKFPSS
ncbi:hypothetical protein ACHAXR_011765 [Thalassiosira sp. AJA248-18]